jgi:hypothetical protein
MPAWAHTLGPVVEKVARILSASSPDAVSVKSVLTRDKNKAAAVRRVATPASPTTGEMSSLDPVLGSARGAKGTAFAITGDDVNVDVGLAGELEHTLDDRGPARELLPPGPA